MKKNAKKTKNKQVVYRLTCLNPHLCSRMSCSGMIRSLKVAVLSLESAIFSTSAPFIRTNLVLPFSNGNIVNEQGRMAEILRRSSVFNNRFAYSL